MPVAVGNAEAAPPAALMMAGLICMALNPLFQAMRTTSSLPGAPPGTCFQDDLHEALVRHLGPPPPSHSQG